MAKKLTSLKLGELSLVDYPANVQSRMTIHKRAGTSPDNQECEMDQKQHDEFVAKMKKEHEDALKSSNEKVTKLEATVADLVTKAKMSDDEKAYMEDLSEDAKKKFMGMSPEDRKRTMSVRKSADDHVVVKGTKIFKSKIGDDAFEVVKSQQADIEKNAEDIRKANEATEMAKLEKRVSDEYPTVVGKSDEKAQVLKHMSTAPEGVRKAFDAIMKSAQDTSDPAFKRIGHGQGNVDKNLGAADVNKARTTFEKKVSEIQKRDTISRLAAMRKAQTECPEEFEAMQKAGEDHSAAA